VTHLLQYLPSYQALGPPISSQQPGWVVEKVIATMKCLDPTKERVFVKWKNRDFIYNSWIENDLTVNVSFLGSMSTDSNFTENSESSEFSNLDLFHTNFSSKSRSFNTVPSCQPKHYSLNHQNNGTSNSNFNARTNNLQSVFTSSTNFFQSTDSQSNESQVNNSNNEKMLNQSDTLTLPLTIKISQVNKPVRNSNKQVARVKLEKNSENSPIQNKKWNTNNNDRKANNFKQKSHSRNDDPSYHVEPNPPKRIFRNLDKWDISNVVGLSRSASFIPQQRPFDNINLPQYYEMTDAEYNHIPEGEGSSSEDTTDEHYLKMHEESQSLLRAQITEILRLQHERKLKKIKTIDYSDTDDIDCETD